MTNNQYFKPFLFAFGLHIVLLSLFFKGHSSQPVAMENANAPIVQASLVAATSPAPAEIAPPAPPKVAVDKQKIWENVAALQEEAEEEAQEVPVPEVTKPPEPEKVVEKPLEKPIKKVEIEKPVTKTVVAAPPKKIVKVVVKKSKPVPQKNLHHLVAQDFDRALAEEGKLLAAGAKKASVSQAVVDRFKAEIVQAIGQRWIVPDLAAHQDLKCKLFIHLGSRGNVLDVRLLASSGDPALDRSAVAAVYKASPLPVPSDPAQFEPFKDLNLTVRPV